MMRHGDSTSSSGKLAVLQLDEARGGPSRATKTKAVDTIAEDVIVIDGARDLKPCMTKDAVWAIFTETGEIIRAGDLLDVAMATFRSMATEAAGVVGALVALLLRVNVPVRTFGIGTLAVLGEEETLRHAAIVDGVQVIA